MSFYEKTPFLEIIDTPVRPLWTMVFDGRPPSSAKGCDSHILSFRSWWGEGEIFPIYYNCQFWGVGGRTILGFLLLDLTIAASKLFYRHFYEEWHSGFCEGLLISKTFDWQGIKQWQRRNLPSEKEKIQFWRKNASSSGILCAALAWAGGGSLGRGRNCWHSTRGKPAPIFSSVSPLANIFPPPCAIMPAVKSAVFSAAKAL